MSHAHTHTFAQAAHGLSLILVDAGTPGFTKGRNLKKIGFKAQVSVIVYSAIMTA